MKLQRKSSNYFDIIRMEREGVEKAGVAGLMSGVQEWRSGGKRKILRKEGGARRWRKSQNPHAPTRSGHAAHKSWPLAKGLPPSTGPCATKYSKKCSIELKQHCLTCLRDYSKSYLTCS